jgi:CRP/FNR family cyclic AMP-dependent transcriptional regulator
MSTEDTLAQVPLFSQLSRLALRRLARGTVSRRFAGGDVIVKEGEQAVAFFFVLSGRVEVVKGAEGPSPKVLTTMGPGDFFGEMALIDDYPRSATVRALEDTECLELWRWDFRYELHRSPSMAVEMLPDLSRRLRQTNTQLAT